MAEKYLDFYHIILDLRHTPEDENDKNQNNAYGKSMQTQQ